MAEFVAAHILDDHKPYDRFTIWPLHITILPPFEAPSTQAVSEVIGPIIEASEPIHALLGDLVQFDKTHTVRKLLPNSELQHFHDSLLLAVQHQGWRLSAKYTGQYYTPHITRKLGRDFEGDSFEIDKLSITEAQPQGYRQIVAEFELGKNE